MKRSIQLAVGLLTLSLLDPVACGGTLEFHTHTRGHEPVAGRPDTFQLVEKVAQWDPAKTVIIICDMWDRHWCRGATARVVEMAPRMNAALQAARQRGIRIIHAPSGTMPFYAGYSQRKRILELPAVPVPKDADTWRSLNRTKEPLLPIDDSDGGCDDLPPCAQGSPWRSQIATIQIQPEDFISDNGQEIYGLLQHLGIDNVIIMGVHTNMCVLGRPFAIRAMVGLGKNVVLMRDLTDTMYNSRRRPWVSHFIGTDLVVEHVEKYWCPSVTSVDLLGGEPFRFSGDRRPRVVFILAENEYQTWETVPAFARQALGWRGLRFDFVMASTRTDDYEFKNVSALKDADLVVVSARRRAMPTEMLSLLRSHFMAGRPWVGLRTASHAFAPRDAALKDRRDLADWQSFDADVLGGNYQGHYPAGPESEVHVALDAAQDPLLTGVTPAELKTKASLYRNAPLPPGNKVLLHGAIPEKPAEPVAWYRFREPGRSRVFYTSLGIAEDFENPAFQRLLLNGILWALDQPVPPAEARVTYQ